MKILSDNRARNNRDFSSSGNTRKKILLNLVQVTIAMITIMVFGLSFLSESWAANSTLLIHNHVSLNVTVAGKPIIVPAYIGINQTALFSDPLLYGDHSLDKYGMKGMSPLHTHDYSGRIHIESNTIRNYTLGDFLNIWKGLNTDGKSVTASVNGNNVSDFRNIILVDKTRIELAVTS